MAILLRSHDDQFLFQIVVESLEKIIIFDMTKMHCVHATVLLRS